MANLSQQKRQRMMEFLSKLKEEHKDDDSILVALGEIEAELNAKKYGLVWEEHEEAVDVMMRDNIPVFTECPEKEIAAAEGDGYNFLLEGDNLHSLYLLEKTHKGKIDVIYIDPPYNTGKKDDFKYNDAFVDSTDAYKHSKWLSFIQKRLQSAHKLLSASGVIFVSINDIEVAQLRLLLDDTFGESNYLAEIAWQCLDSIKNDAKYFSNNHEYILCYAKDIEQLKIQGIKKGEKQWSYYKNYDNDPRGNYLLTPLHAKSGSESGIYEYTFSNGQTWTPPQGTYPRFSKETLARLDKEGRLYLDPNCKKTPQKKTYMSEVSDRMPPVSFWNYEQFGSTRQSNKELSEVLGKGAFQNPKPTKTIAQLIDIIENNKSFTILDFFAGSGTTAHAVMKMNAEDGGNRKFILCTNNENNICEDVTYQRIKTVITGKRSDGSEYSEGIPANLKYYRTDFVSKEEEYLSDALLEHVAEMIQLEHGVKLDGKRYIMLLTDEDADNLADSWSQHPDVKAIYASKNVLFTTKQNNLFKDVEVNIIPDYYFSFELREVGESW